MCCYQATTKKLKFFLADVRNIGKNSEEPKKLSE